MHIATLLWWNQPHPEWLFIFCQYQHGFTNQKPKNLTSKIFINHLSISSDNCMKWGVHLWNMLCKKYTCPLVLNDQQFMWRIVALLYTKFWGKRQPDLYSIRFTTTWARVYIQIPASTPMPVFSWNYNTYVKYYPNSRWILHEGESSPSQYSVECELDFSNPVYYKVCQTDKPIWYSECTGSWLLFV